MAKKKRESWTKEQVKELRVAAKKKTRAPEIAKSMRRTEGAVRQKAHSMGVSLDSR